MMSALLVASTLASLSLMNVGPTDPHPWHTWDPAHPLAVWVTESYPVCYHEDDPEIELPAHVFVDVVPKNPTGPVISWTVSVWGGDFTRNGTEGEAADTLFFARCYMKAATHVADGNLGLSCESPDLDNSGTVDAVDWLKYAGILQNTEPPLTSFGIPEADSLEDADSWGLWCGW